MTVRLLFFGLWLLLHLFSQIGGWPSWPWRRSSSCSHVDCAWGGWSSWGSCNHPCGNDSTQSRSRRVSRSSSCGGSGCSGPSSQTQSCNRFCYNGGTPRSGHCDCPNEFWGTCCGNLCTVIANCLHIVCTSGTNQQCRKCKHDKGGIKKAYRLVSSGGYRNRICEQICSWRSDSIFCYPGKCPGTPSSCQCAPGFGGTNCLTISKKPDIADCLVTAKVNNSQERAEVRCGHLANTVIYTNLLPDTLQVKFSSLFTGPSVALYPRHYYISDFVVGITAARFTHHLVRESVMSTRVDNDGCSSGISRDDPNTIIVECTLQQTIQDVPLQHADSVHFEMSASNGGHVEIRDFNSGNVGPPKYYAGQTVTHKAELVIDLVKPVHCSISSSCSDSMLDRGPPTTKTRELRVHWIGWSDALAGIKGYTLEINKLQPRGNVLAHSTAPIVRKSLSANCTSFNVSIFVPGVYAVVLDVDDNAGNTEVTRRFFIFDNTNVISISSDDDKQLMVWSAAENTSHTWLTTPDGGDFVADQDLLMVTTDSILQHDMQVTTEFNLQDNTTDTTGLFLQDNLTETTHSILHHPVRISWRGHFANVVQHRKKFLCGIAVHSPALDSRYEEATGQPPITVSRQAIPNVNAIVKYEVCYAVDHEGGCSLTNSTTWVSVDDFLSEAMTVDIPRADGDSVRVWVRATDVMGNTKTDSVLVHVDSSPPVIQDVWLSRHGRTQLAVHHSVNLFDTKFEFDSYDFHSGLKEVHWRLHDSLDPNVEHGSGHVAVHRHTGANADCVAPNCYCIPKDNECFLRHFEIQPNLQKMTEPHGSHDFDYNLVLTVTNNAMLTTDYTFKITIDTTAPLPGVVSDSEQSQLDVDFQQGFTQHASWQGFFDRESSILFYQYAFSDSCLAATNFSVPSKEKEVIETTLTYVSRTVSGPGTYHCTVVAYNKALEPSEPVCSDGVTVDTTAPEIHGVSIEKSWTMDGLVKDSSEHVWYIDRNMFRVPIDQPSESCRQKARLKTNTLSYRIRQRWKSSNETNVTLCQKRTFPRQTNIIVSNENTLELSWFGSDDESDVHTYDVGLSSTRSEDLDLMSYTSTHGHRHFITYHPDLMDGETFYIHIKAVNRAGQQTVHVTGPILVKVDAPGFTGHIAVTVQHHYNTQYLVGQWSQADFSPMDLRDGLIYSYSYAVGHSAGTDNIKQFAALTQKSSLRGLCPWTDPPTCVAIPVRDLQWRLHGRHLYYVSLKIKGINDLDRVASSDAYQHYRGPPNDGIVIELPLKTAELLSEDVDHQANQSQLHIAWHSFQHVDQVISYQLAIGSHPGQEDISGYMNVSPPSAILTNLQLKPFETYYATVRASTLDGSTVVSSDGVTILPVDVWLEGVEILDAMPCTKDESVTQLMMSHHDSPLPDKACGVDVDFQSSTSHMGIQWNLPSNVTTLVTDMKWGIQEHTSKDWRKLRELTDAGRVSHVVATKLFLEPGHTYRAVVQFCHQDGCFLPLHSNGVTITPDAPVSDGFISASLNDINITFTWSQFVDPSMPSAIAAVDVISRLEWTLLVPHDSGQHLDHLYPWQWLHSGDIWCTKNEHSASPPCSYSDRLVAPLETSSCTLLALRGYNKVGLYSTITRQLRGCEVTSKVTLTVMDAVASTSDGNILLTKYSQWQEPDREYTSSSSALSAVWPHLRHGTYHWKVVSDDAINRFAYVQPERYPDYNDYDCTAPEVLVCGETQDNFVNVHGLALKEGQRYYICIQANATDLEFEKFTQHLEQNSECSNGIVVDTTPPVAGQVWVGGRQKHWHFQIDQSQLNIYWSSFVDVEVYGHSSHPSGILMYMYAIGTSLLGVDIQDYVDVGVTNMAVVTGLTLQNGQTYYVTVRAMDHVGRSTTASAPGVTIDMTPPGVTAVLVDVGGSYVTERNELPASWKGVFNDDESGIMFYYWCLGSQSGYCDMVSYEETTETGGSQGELRLRDGYPVYVSVQAVNRVGLTAVTVSRAVVVDASPPVSGYVYDVTARTLTTDVDYTTTASEIRSAWGGFHDPHSHVTGYSVNVGKCPQCGDILEKSHVGITTSLHLSDVTLERGITYYTTVEACNGAGLCVTVTSDGVIPDTSPPVAGVVFDGICSSDIEYQSSRSTLSARWVNFHDPESDLLDMEWRAGTSPGHSDILAPTRLHVTDKVTANLTQPLPLGRKVYVTLKVFNKAGLSTESSSDGFVVDTTSPVTVTRLAHDNDIGSFKPNTQVWTSSLSIRWLMSDPESYIVAHFVSLTTRDSVQHNVHAVKLYGDEQMYTFSNVSLSDGEIYYAKVIACNGARLCTTSVSEGILVDSTPPVPGAFAVETGHAAQLTRHQLGWMTYQDNVLRLAWLGFSDAHCDITTFSVTVGTTMAASDLLPRDLPVQVRSTTSDLHGDEGYIQKANISVKSAVQHNLQLYISIWAVNQVGLVSSRLHGTFTAEPSQSAAGTLALVRRCHPVTCEGHCTCAPHGQLTCHTLGNCVNVTGESGYQLVSVYDIDNYSVTPESNTQDIDFTRSQCTLAATWRAAMTPDKAPVWYEWTVGVAGESMGGRLLDVLKEPLWRERGDSNMAVYTVRSSQQTDVMLVSHVKYAVYVRAWYDANTYAVYVSDGVETDSSPPELSRAAKVTELASVSGHKDIDFQTSTSSVTVAWPGVFRDSQAKIQWYIASVSKTLGRQDMAETRVTSSVTQITLRGLTLDVNDVYYSKVVAYNDAGLFKLAYSDGFKVDVTPPVTGQVWNGRGLTDQVYSGDNRTVSAWWRGFSDDQSYIDHYIWCVGTQPGAQDVITCHNIGLNTRTTGQMSYVQPSGTRLYSTVYAVNAAGLKSAGVSSDGVVIDSTPPLPLHKFQLGANLMMNPSFEEDAPISGTQETFPKGWTGFGRVNQTSSSSKVIAQDKQTFVEVICGYIEQSVKTAKTHKYRVSFYVHSPNPSHFHSQQLGFVRLPGFHSAFLVEPTVATSGEWQKHMYYFTASNSTSTIRVGNVGHATGFLLDNVQIQEVREGQRSPPTDPRDPVSSHVQPLHVHVMSRGSYTAVTTAWDIEDPESPVISYYWAVGTVRGGVQLQDFRSVGGQTHAHTAALRLQHGAELHVTAVAKNAAGLTTVIFSDPVTIDLTPPLLCCLNAGGSTLTVSYVTSPDISVTWSVTDMESGVSGCELALGKSPGSQEVQSFTRVPSLSAASVALGPSVSHGETVFSVVRCFNYAGLQSTLVSSGIVMVTESPDVSMATLKVITNSVSHYASYDSHQAETTYVFFGWQGIRDRSGIKSYEVSLLHSTAAFILPWTLVATSSQLFAELTDIDLESYKTYTLMLRATNYAHLTSDVIACNVTIETNAPRVTDAVLRTTWLRRWTLRLDWTGVFTSNSSLLYEVNIGLTPGGIDVLSWTETELTTLRITGVDYTKEHHVTLTAVNKAGLYTTRTYPVTYSPPSV